MTPPALGTLGPHRPVRRALGPPSAILPVAEVQSQQPGNFSLYFQDRVRGVQLLLQPNHFRLELAHLRAERVTLGGPGAALARGQAPQRALTPRLAPSRQVEVYNPSRRSSRPTSPGCTQRSASSRIRSRYSAVNWRRFGLATTSGSGAGFAPLARALGVSSLRSSTPRARAPTSFSVIDSLSVTIGSHLHRPTVIPRGAGVSVMLAERDPPRARRVVPESLRGGRARQAEPNAQPLRSDVAGGFPGRRRLAAMGRVRAPQLATRPHIRPPVTDLRRSSARRADRSAAGAAPCARPRAGTGTRIGTGPGTGTARARDLMRAQRPHPRAGERRRARARGEQSGRGRRRARAQRRWGSGTLRRE